MTSLLHHTLGYTVFHGAGPVQQRVIDSFTQQLDLRIQRLHEEFATLERIWGDIVASVQIHLFTVSSFLP